ncbi:exodeoxyribonuclease VII large subunit [Phocicoccus pinnipedialis]|uniref:Exodeoxyribonuclease 7 large subunit n=1 Tax=Phocicoccus pinnipedialis TaxID=110845 RepID=A0A6V7RFZ8_9BACL|nr:exodeoxyribonuclease VII large subunit [Jeotgalicoccus pinnipedialis]MBP1939321.1 exodeoxyribonuclease VII large subunit [Jeotgalicoccus pinnipedialis]CAD2075887.1 Exodeoxyribonuclease 7 large subunit [Jeotgalicoccus pinnipedialis]
MTKDRYLSVNALTTYIAEKFVKDPYLERVFVQGELSNAKLHSSGHLYFSLKDENSQIRGIMFQSQVEKLNFRPKDGDKVIVDGRVSVYKGNGTYSINASNMILDGVGLLFLQLDENIKRLRSEGLFNTIHKKPIPKYPKHIVLITSKTSAAVRDMITAVERRFPLVKISILNTLMQGERSKKNVIKHLRFADSLNADTIILSRGGGSIEDLWTFNDIDVARTVFDLNTPIITGIGHETDTTLVDFVSDLRATTPTAAIEHAVPDQFALYELFKNYEYTLSKHMNLKIEYKRKELDMLKNYYKFRNPSALYDQQVQKLDQYVGELEHSIMSLLTDKNHYFEIRKAQIFKTIKNNQIEINRAHVLRQNEQIKQLIKNQKDRNKLRLKNKIDLLDSLSPLLILKRGYSYSTIDRKVITDIDEISLNDTMKTKLNKGTVWSKVIEVEKDD